MPSFGALRVLVAAGFGLAAVAVGAAARRHGRARLLSQGQQERYAPAEYVRMVQ